MKKIYLAIPYSRHEKESFKLANKIAGRLIKDGYLIFSPISMSHPIATSNKLQGDWETWRRIDFEFIKWCDEMLIINYDNEAVSKSVGVQDELMYAKEIGKPIRYYYELK